MIKPDLAVARSLVTLKNAPELEATRNWLTDSLADVDRQLRTAEGTRLVRLQGEAQCLERLIDRMNNARDIANKLSR